MEQFDEYCERVGFALLAEPINALSNLAFIVAAYAAWSLAKRTGTLTTGVKALITLSGATAIGSMLWHTLANTWSLWLDVVPIVLFIVVFVWLYTRQVMEQVPASPCSALPRSFWESFWSGRSVTTSTGLPPIYRHSSSC